MLVVQAVADYTDPNGHDWLTRLDYGSFGLPIEQVDPLEYVTVTHRDSDGLTTNVRDALDYATRYLRDEQGNVVERIDADGYSELFAYNEFSQMTLRTDRGGFVWKVCSMKMAIRRTTSCPTTMTIRKTRKRGEQPPLVYTVDADGKPDEPGRPVGLRHIF